MHFRPRVQLGLLTLTAFAFAATAVIAPPRAASADVPGPITTRVMAILEPALANGGTGGMYLKEVGGPVIAAQGETATIEPASTIKTLIHLYTIDQVEEGNAAFTDQVPVWDTPPNSSCPTIATTDTESIESATAAMMRVSSNGSAKALEEHWTTATLNTYATTLGLTGTALSGVTFGCDPTPFGRHESTLADLGAIFEAAADGSELTAPFEQKFNSLMSGREQDELFGGDFTGIWDVLVAMVDEEMPAGMPQTLKDSFLAGMTAHHKGGSGGRCDNGPCTQLTEWLTWAGSAAFPTCEGGAPTVKQYVWGVTLQDVVDTAFVAPGPSASSAPFVAARAEPLREQMRAALESWGDCFPHWEVIAKTGGGNVLNPNLPDYVPGTWVNKSVTVYLRCVPADAPIKTFRGDRAVTFSTDGSHYYNVGPRDECIDTLGRSAPPLALAYGPIQIDKSAPVCKFTPSQQFIPRNTEQEVTFTTLFDAEVSGPQMSPITTTVTGGAVITSPVDFDGSPATSMSVTVQMPNSTAARVEVEVAITDKAGNLTRCKAIVRAK